MIIFVCDKFLVLSILRTRQSASLKNFKSIFIKIDQKSNFIENQSLLKIDQKLNFIKNQSSSKIDQKPNFIKNQSSSKIDQKPNFIENRSSLKINFQLNLERDQHLHVLYALKATWYIY